MTDNSILNGETLREIKNLQLHGWQRGYEFDIRELRQYLSIKFPNTMYLYSSPQSGKSTFNRWFHIDFAVRHKKRVLMYDPEIGSGSDAYARLIQNYTGKKITDIDKTQMNDAIKWMKNNVTVMAKTKSLEEIYQEFESGGYNMLSIDTWLSVAHRTEPNHTYLNEELPKFRELMHKHKSHGTIVNHVNEYAENLKTGKDKDGNEVKFYGHVTPAMMAGGQAWARHGDVLLRMWRPAKGLVDANGKEFSKDSVYLYVDKLRPEHLGEIIQTGGIKLYYFKDKFLYHGEDYNRLDELAPMKPIEPNTNFLEEDEIPF